MKLSDYNIKSLRILPTAILTVGMLIFASSCGDNSTDFVNRETDGNLVPTMTTRNVETLISDSGIIRYRITTPLWLVFDEAKEPLWRFPTGLHLEKYNDSFQRDASIDADSATYFKDQDLWRLDGRVYIINTSGEKFLSEQLYWSNREHKVYTDSFIHIERQDRVIEGYGFVSNDRMTNYSVNKVSGIFPISDFRGGDAPDSTIVNDSVATAPIVKSQVSPKPQQKQPTRPQPDETQPTDTPTKPGAQLRLKPNPDRK